MLRVKEAVDSLTSPEICRQSVKREKEMGDKMEREPGMLELKVK